MIIRSGKLGRKKFVLAVAPILFNNMPDAYMLLKTSFSQGEHFPGGLFLHPMPDRYR